jgi:Ca-activated chloride channel family protein
MKHLISIVFSLVCVLSLTACAAAATRTPAATQAPAQIAANPRSDSSSQSAQTEAPAEIAANPSSQTSANETGKSEGSNGVMVYPTPESDLDNYLEATAVTSAPLNGMDNYFQDYGVNSFVSTGRDHLSTFALDVDTASYGVTRQYIEDGQLPPMDAVRTEEFVNAFDQGYSSTDDSAFSVFADGAPSPFIDPGNYLVRFGVQGYRIPDSERKPLNLTFVIDVSGSMATDNRLGMVQDALTLLVKNLDSRDTVTIVAYSTEARLVLEPTNASDVRIIIRAINSLRPTNSTNVEAGLRLGYRYAARTLDTEAVNRVILCSDGVANVGDTSSDSILDYVQGYVDEGITLTAIGVGMGNFNDVLLEQLADHGNGNYFYVNSQDEAEKVFVENLTGTMQVIAYDAKIQIDFNPEVVESYRLIGYENRDVADQDFRNDSVDAGEIGAGMTATALYEIELKPEAAGRIATAQLRWQDPDTREVIEINGNMNTYDLSSRFEETSPYFQLDSTVAAFAEILRASPYVQGNLSDVADEARRISRSFGENEQAVEFLKLAQQAERLDRR